MKNILFERPFVNMTLESFLQSDRSGSPETGEKIGVKN